MPVEDYDQELLEAMGIDYPGLSGMDASALERIEMLPDGTFNARFPMSAVYCVARESLESLVSKYIEHIELSPTAVVCKCTWLIHPDDEDLPPVKQRKKRSIEHPRCMVHTKLGFLMGFFAWMFPEEEVSDSQR